MPEITLRDIHSQLSTVQFLLLLIWLAIIFKKTKG